MEVHYPMIDSPIFKSIQKGILRCCSSQSKFQITYLNGKTWLVCSSCFKLKIWNRFIKSKTNLSKKQSKLSKG